MLSLKMKTLRAKYQLKPDIFVTCYLEVEDVDETQLRGYVGIKRRADSTLPKGTRLFLNLKSASPDAKIVGAGDAPETFETAFVRVLDHQVYSGEAQPVHICSPLQYERHPERRAASRIKTHFLVNLGEDREFYVENGTLNGLSLVYQPHRPTVNLIQGKSYPFQVLHKGSRYAFPGILKHIHYNWHTHEHRLGVLLEPMSQANEIVLNVLLDPAFSTELGAAAVDAATGKITGL